MNLDDEGQAISVGYLEGFYLLPVIIVIVVCGSFLTLAASCSKQLNCLFCCTFCCFFVMAPYALSSGAETAYFNEEILSD